MKKVKRNPATTPPKSYWSARRLPLLEALNLEGCGKEGLEILKRKGFFSPPARPWKVGFNDRGMGHGSYAVLDRFGEVVAQVDGKETAKFIVEAVKAYKPKRKRRNKKA